MSRVYAFLLLLLSLLHGALGQFKDASIHKLLIEQFKQTGVDAAPHSLGTTLYAKLHLREFLAIEHEHLTSRGKFYVEEEFRWNTRQQIWEPAQFSNIESVKLPAEHMWTPDVILDNPHSFSRGDSERSALVIQNDGLVKWTDLRVVTVPCYNDPHYTITCLFKYRTLSFDSSEYDLQISGSEGIDTTSYVPSASHKIHQMKSERYELYKPCCEETFPQLVFNVTMMPYYK